MKYNHTKCRLDYVATTSFAVNTATIADRAGNVMAVDTLPAPAGAGSLGANAAIVLDTAPPTITSVVGRLLVMTTIETVRL